MKKILLSALAAVLLTNGCAVRFISDYDQKTDDATSSVYSKLRDGLMAHEVPDQPGILPEQEKLYSGVQSDLHAIEIRAKAIDKNTITVQQIQAAEKAVENIKQLDRLGYDADSLKLILSNWDSICGSILKLEIAKKRN